jgi:hypothetical protein
MQRSKTVNFAEVRKIKGQRENNFPKKLDMYATFAEPIEGCSYNRNQKLVCKTKLIDDMNEKHLVTLYVKQPIPPNMANQRQLFKIYAFDGTYGPGNNPYEGYAGLWQDRPQSTPTTSSQPAQGTNSPNMTQQDALAMLDKLVGWVASMRPQAPPPQAPPQQQAQGGQPNPNYDENYQPPDDSIPF